MEIIQIGPDNYEPFEPLLGPDVTVAVRFNAEVFALALVEEEQIYGAIACEHRDFEIAVRALYVLPEYRRQGYGTTLLEAAADIAAYYDGLEVFTTDFTEALDEDNGLKEFFTFAGFELEEDPDAVAYQVTIGDLIEAKGLQVSDIPSQIENYAHLTSGERGLLLQEPHPFMPLYMDGGWIEPEASCFLNDEYGMLGCVVFVSGPDDLSLEWVRIDPKASIHLIPMLAYSARALAAKYPRDKKLIIPVISAESHKLVKHLFGDRLELLERSWTGTWNLEDDSAFEDEQ